MNEIDKYIDQFPENTREILTKIKNLITELVPEAEQTINYQIPTFKLNKKNMVHFAGYSNHVGFYPTPAGISKFQDQISSYKSAKGSVQFPLDKPIPYNLIKEMVLFRKNQILGDPKSKL